MRKMARDLIHKYDASTLVFTISTFSIIRYFLLTESSHLSQFYQILAHFVQSHKVNRTGQISFKNRINLI